MKKKEAQQLVRDLIAPTIKDIIDDVETNQPAFAMLRDAEQEQIIEALEKLGGLK